MGFLKKFPFDMELRAKTVRFRLGQDGHERIPECRQMSFGNVKNSILRWERTLKIGLGKEIKV